MSTSNQCSINKKNYQVEEDMHILVDIEYIKGEIRLPNFVYPSSEEDLMVQVV